MEFKVLSHLMLHFMLLTLTIGLLLRLPTNHCCELNGITLRSFNCLVYFFFKQLVQVGLASIYRLPFCLKILTIACNYEEIKFKYINVNCLPVSQEGAVRCEALCDCNAV